MKTWSFWPLLETFWFELFGVIFLLRPITIEHTWTFWLVPKEGPFLGQYKTSWWIDAWLDLLSWVIKWAWMTNFGCMKVQESSCIGQTHGMNHVQHVKRWATNFTHLHLYWVDNMYIIVGYQRVPFSKGSTLSKSLENVTKRSKVLRW